jgi:hypothetical protein
MHLHSFSRAVLPRIFCVSWLATFISTTAGFAAAGSAADEVGFSPLGNGRDMSAFDLVGAPAETWSVDDGSIRCTGKPNGYFATKRSYRNFVLRFDFRYARPADLTDDAAFRGNSGFLIYLTGEPKVWPKCVEVQGMNKEIARIFAIGGAPAVKASDNPEARQKALRPVGEWNSLEIASRDGALTSTLNGVVICTSEPGEYREGPIGFQSEGAEIHFRNLRIKELP